MSSTTNSLYPIPSFTFRLKVASLPKFSPRLGHAIITRPAYAAGEEPIKIEISTPGIVCSTTRGVIEHLSRDNVKKTSAIKWIHVPFESFLQVDPPIPTREDGNNPLHTFLGYSPSQHLLSLSLRDPADARDMPANGNLFVAAQSSRGTRKVALPAYRSYGASTMPDIVFAMSDVPFMPPPHSQKRINKSIERSSRWLASLIAPIDLPFSLADHNSENMAVVPTCSTVLPRFNVFLHMVGGIKKAARSAFASSLQELLDVKEKQLVQLETLDDGVCGYVFDLAPLRLALLAEQPLTDAASMHDQPIDHDSIMDSFVSLIHSSLKDLPAKKPRLVNTALSPHEMLVLIRDTGIDLFDTFWAQRAATWGVALDFRFPVRTENTPSHSNNAVGKRQLGINIFDSRFANDFGRLSEHFMDGLEYSKQNGHLSSEDPAGQATFCACAACSPIWRNDPVIHSSLDGGIMPPEELAPPYTRAYIHHLLHTHEMSAHSLLAMHNITIMDAFMRGIRSVLQCDPDRFTEEVTRFQETYDGPSKLLEDARSCWAAVNLARGKGRLAREREASKSVESLEVSNPS